MALWQLKKIDKRTKYSVHGWIRNKEKQLKLNHIPSVIKAMCILYFREEEIFDIISDNGIKLSENKKIITKITRYTISSLDCSNNYGIIEIPSESDSICRWDLKVINNDYDSIAVGIASKRIPNSKIYRKEEECIYYLFSEKCMKRNGALWKSRFGDDFGKGDQVSINLDLRRAEVELLINGNKKGIRFQNIVKAHDIGYWLIVSLDNHNDCVEIMNFTRK